MSADVATLNAWAEQRRADREALAATYDYTWSTARACADLPLENRLAFAFGALCFVAERRPPNLPVLAHELQIACAAVVIP